MTDDANEPGAEPDGLDLHALLAATLDRPVPSDLSDRVVSRIALMETVLEFGRLLGLAPSSAAGDALRKESADGAVAEQEAVEAVEEAAGGEPDDG